MSKQEAGILTDRLTTKLISIGKYQVVERNNMDKILKEQKFQKSGCTPTLTPLDNISHYKETVMIRRLIIL